MKKVISVFLVICMLGGLSVGVHGAPQLENPLCFTWAWGGKRIDTDNEVKVVSWSGGSYGSYRSSFIVYDLPESFEYKSVKSEVVIAFAINKATLNNGEGQAPTAAIVLVNGDKIKEAYGLKSGDKAAKLLSEAKDEGIYFGEYKIGKYPRTSRIRNAVINEYFEKNEGVGSIGFYVTNIPTDGYAGMGGGIASGMSDFEVNFEHFTNYANMRVNLVSEGGAVLDVMDVRNAVGSRIEVPVTIEDGGIIYVRDNDDVITIGDNIKEINVTYHNDAKGREGYPEEIEESVRSLSASPVKEKINLPTEIAAEDGFVIKVEWYSSNEDAVGSDGSVYMGEEAQTAQLYAKVWIGEYTCVETGKIEFTVAALNTGEVDASCVYEMCFDDEINKRGEFNGEGIEIAADAIDNEFTISAYVRCDDLSRGGSIFDFGELLIEVDDIFLTEGEWAHVCVNNNAVYVNGEKAYEGEYSIGKSGIAGAFIGKADNIRLYAKTLSAAVIKTLAEEEYDTPKIEIISSSVVDGMDSVIIKVGAKGYGKSACAIAFSDYDGVRHAGYCEREIADGLNVLSVNIPDMRGSLSKDGLKSVLWDGAESMRPISDIILCDRVYDFSFNYTNPDNHMLSNVFTLMNADTGKLLKIGESERLTAPFENCEGYFSLKNTDGEYKEGNWSFIKSDCGYLLKNKDSGNYLCMTGSSVHEKSTADLSCEWILSIKEFDDVSKAFASEGFFLLSKNERERLYAGSGQALFNSKARRDELLRAVSGDYFEQDGAVQAQRLRAVFEFVPSYQINRAVNKSTTGYEAEYTLSDITSASYTGLYDESKTGYTAKAVYKHEKGERAVIIYARSHNVVKNIAKGLSYMPYQFVQMLKTVTDYYDNTNQFKAEAGEMFILTNYEVSAENVSVTGAHELGHLVDFAGYRISVNEAYRNALVDDCYVLSGYADTARSEDFAEFVQFVISCMGDREQLRQLKEMFPGRYFALCEGMCEMYGTCILK